MNHRHNKTFRVLVLLVIAMASLALAIVSDAKVKLSERKLRATETEAGATRYSHVDTPTDVMHSRMIQRFKKQRGF